MAGLEAAIARLLTVADASLMAQQAQASMASAAEQHQAPEPTVERYLLNLRKQQQADAGDQLLPPPPLEPHPGSLAFRACATVLAALQREHVNMPRGPALVAALARRVPQPPEVRSVLPASQLLVEFVRSNARHWGSCL